MIAEATEQQPDYSNVSFMMVKNHVIRHGDKLEIYHLGKVTTLEQFDCVIWMVLNFLNLEGFLDNQSCAIENIFVFDDEENQIQRDQFLNDEAI